MAEPGRRVLDAGQHTGGHGAGVDRGNVCGYRGIRAADAQDRSAAESEQCGFTINDMK